MRIIKWMLCVILCGAFIPSNALPVDSITNLLEPKVQDIKYGRLKDFSKTDFCNCNNDQLAPIISIREVNSNKLNELLASREFQYNRTVKDEASSFWYNFWRWLSKKLFGNITEQNAIRTRNIFFWIIGVFAILIVSYWLYRSEFFGGPLRRTAKINDNFYHETERSEEDIEAFITDALKNENYPLAIRWVYIKCIKILALKQEIEIRHDKTNHDYYLEIRNKNLLDAFARLTKLFEYTNYGSFETDISHYHEAFEIVKSLSNKTA